MAILLNMGGSCSYLYPSHITKGSEVKIQGEIEKKQKNCYTTIQD